MMLGSKDQLRLRDRNRMTCRSLVGLLRRMACPTPPNPHPAGDRPRSPPRPGSSFIALLSCVNRMSLLLGSIVVTAIAVTPFLSVWLLRKSYQPYPAPSSDAHPSRPGG